MVQILDQHTCTGTVIARGPISAKHPPAGSASVTCARTPNCASVPAPPALSPPLPFAIPLFSAATATTTATGQGRPVRATAGCTTATRRGGGGGEPSSGKAVC